MLRGSGSRRYRRLYVRQSLKFWLLGALLCLVAAVGVIALKFMFDTVYEEKMKHHTGTVSKR